MIEKKRNKIPFISPERLDTSKVDTSITNDREEQKAVAFLKGKEIIQPFTIRIPEHTYKKLRKIAFDENIKINQIIIGLIKEYTEKKL